MFMTAKMMVKTNRGIISEQCIRNGGVLTVSVIDKKMAWKSYHEKLLNSKILN